MAEIREYTARISAGDNRAYGDFVITTASKTILLAGIFDRSKLNVEATMLSIAHRRVSFNYRSFNSSLWELGDYGYVRSTTRIGMGYESMNYGVLTNEGIGERWLVTSQEGMLDSAYKFLRSNYVLPIRKDWTDYIIRSAVGRNHVTMVSGDCCSSSVLPEKKISFAEIDGGREVCLKDIQVYDFGQLTQDILEEIVSDGLKTKAIRISDKEMKPLEFEGFDDYLAKYGKTLADNLEEQITPRTPLKEYVDGHCLKTKRLYPQQASCTEGMIALMKSGAKAGLMNEGMGVGKTLQACSAVEGYFGQTWLKEHPGATLETLYEEDNLNYRVIVMCPPHLCAKWAQEIEEEIPYATAKVIGSLSDLIKIRESGRERKGRQFFIISKDKAKLGSAQSPTPHIVGHKVPVVKVCASCLTGACTSEEQANKLLSKYKPVKWRDLPFRYKVPVMRGYGNNQACPDCGGKESRTVYFGVNRQHGLVCPHCSELLVKDGPKLAAGPSSDYPGSVWPDEFALGQTSATRYCYNCGGVLWGYDVNPGKGGKEGAQWKTIEYYSTAKKDKTSRALVLKGYEGHFEKAYKFGQPTIKDHEYGTRKYPLERYAKKYLKGYFDVCILDECHKFEGFASAQANAAHSFMKCADFTLGLTGTIANGSASSFFSILWKLCPHKMVEKGYTFSEQSALQFAKKYGTVETSYEDDGSGRCNRASRGRVTKSARVKPGISPLIFTDFLLEISTFLDIEDMSRFLPPLNEYVERVDLPDDVSASYHQVIDALRSKVYTKEGAGSMSDMLQFSLSYPDKPYSRKPILSGTVEDYVLASPENFDEYGVGDKLLPKEERIVEIVNKEVAEGRNVFIFASYTGKDETNVTGRIADIIETRCNLKNSVEVLYSTKPSAQKRESYLHKKAADGIKVFVCNPKLVETGMNFIFKEDGVLYNYPTIIFMQTNYELATIWQASRRHYRLNQVEECRTYWLAYDNTMQSVALDIMSQKMAAVSSVQGKFSASGLVAMARGVDARVLMAQALASGDMSARADISSLADVKASADDTGAASFIPPRTFYEITGGDDMLLVTQAPKAVDFEVTFDFPSVETDGAATEEASLLDLDLFGTDDLFGVFDDMFSDFGVADIVEPVSETPKKKAKKAPKMAVGQTSLFDLF